jgi:phage baseplate assembly protein W|tara:strand:+ start:314 stop:811 length:498 start_codon:yes stop_codon:yes gene_type:complete
MAKVKLVKTTTSDITVAEPSRLKTYIGFSTVNRDFDNNTLHDYELARTDLLNNLYIKKGEKLENPDYGTIVWDLLFEPFSAETSKQVEADMKAMVDRDPRWRLNTLQVQQEEHGLNVMLDITYVPYNIGERLSLLFNETTGLRVDSLSTNTNNTTVTSSGSVESY